MFQSYLTNPLVIICFSNTYSTAPSKECVLGKFQLSYRECLLSLLAFFLFKKLNSYLHHRNFFFHSGYQSLTPYYASMDSFGGGGGGVISANSGSLISKAANGHTYCQLLDNVSGDTFYALNGKIRGPSLLFSKKILKNMYPRWKLLP